MAKKFQTLLDINAIMKQRVEKQFADLVKQGEAIKREIEVVEAMIHGQKANIVMQAQNDPLSINVFNQWEEAQRRKINRLLNEGNTVKEKQAPLRQELSSIFVKEKMLLARLEQEQKEQSFKIQKDRAEKTQAIWLQNNFNLA